MNLLELKYGGEELIENFNDELIFLNSIIGEQSTEEQLTSVQNFLNDGSEDLNDAIDAADIEGIIETDDIEDFKRGMRMLLMCIQFPSGAKPKDLRGAGSSPLL